MGVSASLEVCWCSADGPASGIERSVSSAHGPAFIAGLSDVSTESCTVVVYFPPLWPFAFPQRPLVSISFVVAGTVDVCY
jgi:hypothetical protein